MKKIGLIILSLGVACILFAVVWPQQAAQDKMFIRAAEDLRDTVSMGEPTPDPQRLDQQTEEASNEFRGQLKITANHFFAAGEIVGSVGLLVYLAGLAMQKGATPDRKRRQVDMPVITG